MQRGFAPIIILFVILVIAIIVGGAYYLGKSSQVFPQLPQATPIVNQTSPSPVVNQTANWQTYTDKNLNFTFKYPPGLIAQPYTNADGILSLTLSSNEEAYGLNAAPKSKLFPNIQSQIRIPGQQTVGEFKSNYVTWEILSSTNYCDAGNCSKTYLSYYLKVNGTEVLISQQKPVTKTKNLEQILSTFKFTQ